MRRKFHQGKTQEELNPLVRRFCASAAARALAEPAWHALNSLKALRKEVTESMAMLRLIESLARAGVELGPVAADAPWAVIPVIVAPRRPANCARLAGTISMTGAERTTAAAWLGARSGRAEKASTLRAAPPTSRFRIATICCEK